MIRSVTALALITALAVLAAAPPALAIGTDSLRINGTGNWYYAKSDGNSYLADEDGDYDNAEFSLSFTALPSDKVTIVLQPFWEISDEGTEVEFDVGFGEYAFADSFKLRFGIDRHPFGIYTPIYDVGTLRPFMLLPTGIYSEGAGIVAESYAGIGVSGLFHSGSWSFGYDLYGGAMNLQSAQPWEEEEEGMEEAGEEGEEGVMEEFELEDVIGARVVAHTPVDGLSFGASIYSGAQTGEAEGGALEGNRDTSYGVQVEYLTDKISLRSEYARQDLEDEFETDAFYVEGAYMITGNIQAAVRYDWSDSSLGAREEEKVDDVEAAFLEHAAWDVGLNWWFSPNLVVKLSYHIAEGLRYAMPEDTDEGDLETKTNTVVLGASFSF